MKTAIIFGVSGQDGSYLTKYLLENDYRVIGASRSEAQPENHMRLGISENKNFSLIKLNPLDRTQVLELIKEKSPAEIYNLAGQSSVGISFKEPYQTYMSNFQITLNILESLRLMDGDTRFLNAGSGECFGANATQEPVTEDTPFSPLSPYGYSKAIAHELVKNYRETYDLFCCTGIFFNHESPLRNDNFVTKKIIRSAIEIHNSKLSKLELGNLDVSRDWGWAPEYMIAAHKIVTAQKADDYIIATGRTHSLKDFLDYTFSYFGMNWEDYVTQNPSLIRPNESKIITANPEKIQLKLGWTAIIGLKEICTNMINAELSTKSD